MAATILMTAIVGLFFGGGWVALWSKRAAMIDARVSFAIAHAIVPRKMRRAWRRAENFKKNAGRKKIQLVYKTFGIGAVFLAIVLTIFLTSIS